MLRKQAQKRLIKEILKSYMEQSEKALAIQKYATEQDFFENLLFNYYRACDTITQLNLMQIISEDLAHSAHASLSAHIQYFSK